MADRRLCVAMQLLSNITYVYLICIKEVPMHFTFVFEGKVETFLYWQAGIQKGMRHLNELYEHVSTFPLANRLQAYDLSHELMGTGSRICLTLSSEGYSVWKSLKTAS